MIYTTSTGILEIGEDFVAIKTLGDESEGDTEIAYWIQDEWADSPDLLLTITNAVAIFFTEGAHVIAERISKNFDSNGMIE